MKNPVETSNDLIRRAQGGDDQAANDLMRLIRDYHTQRVVRKYSGRNVLIPDDDIESEFLLGCWIAVQKAKLNVGNPLNFIVWKGNLQVVNLFRNRIKKEVRFTCLDCGDQGRIAWSSKVPVCSGCGSRDLWTTMFEVSDQPAGGSGHDTGTSLAASDRVASASAEHIWQIATFGVQVEELRARLNGRVLQLFDLIVIEGISRESSKNYLQEIADRWCVSTAAVASYLRKLRTEVLDYIGEG